jgi:hypothetical protein
MPLYAFYVRTADGVSTSLEAHEAQSDGEAFERAAEVLSDHYSADHVEVWEGARAVVARHRNQPIIRPVPPPDVQLDAAAAGRAAGAGGWRPRSHASGPSTADT